MNEAVYTPSPLPEYAGNPLIEALPPMDRSDDALMQDMAIMPTISEEERQLPACLRLDMAYRVLTLFIPLPPHFELLTTLSTCLRRSYTWRNPLQSATQTYLHHPLQGLGVSRTNSLRAASSFLIFVKGLSGIGKSRGIEACLRAIGPPLIRHVSYHGRALVETQIVWLKLSCPEDRSLKSLCRIILAAVDETLGEQRYCAQFQDDPRTTTVQLINTVLICLANEHVGILVVDEIQNLFASKGQPALEVLNFLLRLREESGICVVMCGTYASLHLLQKKFRLSRRIAGGDIEMKRPADPKDPEWMNFVEILWNFQWLPSPRPFDQEHANVLFDLTQGIRGVAVSLFLLAQLDAIRQSSQEIDSAFLRTTWRLHFAQLDNAMAALRTRDSKALAEWDDLCDTFAFQKPSADRDFATPKDSPSTADHVRNGKGRARGAKKAVDPDLARLAEAGGMEALRAAGIVGIPDEVAT